LISCFFANAQSILNPSTKSNIKNPGERPMHSSINYEAQRNLKSSAVDPCVQTFNNNYRSSSFCDMLATTVESKDHNLVGYGFMRETGTDAGSEKGTLIKMDKTGNILLKKKLSQDGMIRDVIMLKDSMILAPSDRNNKLILTKLDDQFNIIWNKSFDLGKHIFNYRKMIEEADGSFYMLIDYDNPYPPFLAVIKFSKNGDYLWQKNYAANNAWAGFWNTRLIELNGYLYFKTETEVNNYYPTVVIFKVNMQDGGIVWTKYYNNPIFKFARSDLFFSYKDHIVLAGGVETEPPVYKSYPVISLINEDGSLDKTVIFKSGSLTITNITSATTSSKGDIIFQTNANDYSLNPYIYGYTLIRVDPNLHFESGNLYRVNNNNGGFLMEASDRSIYNYGNNFYPDPYSTDFFMRKYTPDLKLGNCYTQPFSVTDSLIEVSSAPVSFNYSPEITITPATESFVLEDYDLKLNQELCKSVNTCDQVKLQGSQRICNSNDTLTFTVKRNAGCSMPVSFLIDPAYAEIVYHNDSTAKIKYKASGNTMLYAVIDGCKPIWDSIPISIHLSKDSLNLGSDLELCDPIEYKLHAGTSFETYLWQDGSIDSTFMVNKAGSYYVHVKNLCGNAYSDTILISSAIVPKLFIGKDTSVCIEDTLTIGASPGFISYQWQASGLLSIEGKAVSLISSGSQPVSVIATTAAGCKAYDTLGITSIKARPVYLGKDTSFCASDSILLSAGSGYSQYTWSNGGAAETIVVNKAGTFWVKVKDVNDCTATDTFTIKQLFALPALSLGNDFDLCYGEQKKLDAGNFNQYEWNDGSSERYKTVNTEGLYWVTVMDMNNCAATDSVWLKNIFPLPANFLKKTDSLCEFDKLTIIPGKNYSRYLWSTGSIASTLVATTTGQYILTVTDGNNCMGKDSILIVPKSNCTTAIFIPNAFTPNGDHLNDLFKAKVFGNIISFRLQVYNQWGQQVFSTDNPGDGWDGKMKGEPADPGVFVWLCTYQLEGRKPSIQKGTVTLIR
jgi:gliding motility-associated-like protein